MRKIIGVISIWAISLGATASASSQFDLECSGLTTEKSLYHEQALPYKTHYRIDLARKKWCEEDCKAVWDIFEVQATFLTLRAIVGTSSSSYIRVDRETGEHLAGRTEKGARGPASTVAWNWRGQCSKASFSGFPSFQTRF